MKVKQNSLLNYLTSMSLRLIYIQKSIKPTGSFYLHCDSSACHHLKIILDYIFGIDKSISTITWRRSLPKNDTKTLGNCADFLLFYSKSKNFIYNIQKKEYKESTKKAYKYEDENGFYSFAPTSSPEKGYKYDLGYGEKMPSKGYRWTKETMEAKIKEGIVFIKKGTVPVYKVYLKENSGVALDNIWEDINFVGGSKENLGYPTQKPEALLERIILSSSNEGDTVADFYLGGGTTAAVCKKLNRNFIGCDISELSINIINKRLNERK